MLVGGNRIFNIMPGATRLLNSKDWDFQKKIVDIPWNLYVPLQD